MRQRIGFGGFLFWASGRVSFGSCYWVAILFSAIRQKIMILVPPLQVSVSWFLRVVRAAMVVVGWRVWDGMYWVLVTCYEG